MPPLLELLASIAPGLEQRVKAQMTGFAAMFVRPYLPQRWVFVTESETATLVVDANGGVSAVAGVATPADVTVKIGLERLRIALTTRNKELVPPGPLEVTPHTCGGTFGPNTWT
ncbi:MAG: hypothetical protein L3J96_06790, partial [Thermoplasmata archaeon]|nr:hypothetical protein [Thermoplasmata archaeon]